MVTKLPKLFSFGMCQSFTHFKEISANYVWNRSPICSHKPLFLFSLLSLIFSERTVSMSRQPQKTGSLKFSRNELQFHSQTSKGLCAHWFNEYWDFFVLSLPHSISCLCHDISDQKLEYQFYSERSELCLHFGWTKVQQKCQKWSILASFWKPEVRSHTVLPDRSVLIGQKLVENVKISNASNAMFRVIFNFSLKKLGPSKSKNFCYANIDTKFKPYLLEIENLFSKLDALKIFH